jgi:hypothetical protein
MSTTIDFIKKVNGISTYKNVIDTNFREFIIEPPTVVENPVTVDQFFSYYDQLFYDIPITGEQSHTILVQRSTQYIGGSVIDEEKAALIEEINTLKQQIIELSQTYLTVGDITK